MKHFYWKYQVKKSLPLSAPTLSGSPHSLRISYPSRLPRSLYLSKTCRCTIVSKPITPSMFNASKTSFSLLFKHGLKTLLPKHCLTPSSCIIPYRFHSSLHILIYFYIYAHTHKYFFTHSYSHQYSRNHCSIFFCLSLFVKLVLIHACLGFRFSQWGLLVTNNF